MKYLHLLLLSCFLFACESTPNSITTDSDSLTNSKPQKATFKELLQLFVPLRKDYVIDALVFEKNEKQTQGQVIPEEMIQQFLGSNQQLHPQAKVTTTAVCQIIEMNYVGLLVLEKTFIEDRINQIYTLYVFEIYLLDSKPAARLTGKQQIAFHRTGGGSRELQTAKFFPIYKGHWIVAGYLQMEKDEWIDSGEKESLYQKYEAKIEYLISPTGEMQTNQIGYFDAGLNHNVSQKSMAAFKLVLPDSDQFDNWQNRGGTENAIAWNDANGYNAVFFVRKTRDVFPELTVAGDEAEGVLRAYHYTQKEGKSKVLWEMEDYETLCEFDFQMNFLYPSVELTDLNKNNIAEISFLYSYTCTSDVSAHTLKFLLYENGEKYALSGYGSVNYGSEIEPSYYEADKAFDTAPQGFLEFAEQQWQKYE